MAIAIAAAGVAWASTTGARPAGRSLGDTGPTTTLTANCSAARPASFAARAVAGLFETDLTTHRRFEAVRALSVTDPDPVVFAGGDLYLTYQEPDDYLCTRVARVRPGGGPVLQSPWLPLSGPPAVAYGSVWATAYERPNVDDAQVLYRLRPDTLAIERKIPLGTGYNAVTPVASAGAIWLAVSRGTTLGRIDARTGRLSRVSVPGLKKDLSISGLVAGPGDDTLYISAVDQSAARWTQATERFHPATGRFQVVAGNFDFPIVRLIGVTGDLLWVSLMGGNVGHDAPVSAVTMTPIYCAIEGPCTFDGLNGTFAVTTGADLAWMSHAGGWLECAGAPTGSVRATIRVPGFGPITDGYSGKDSATSPLAAGDGYVAVDPQFANPHEDAVGPDIAIFPVDPRCEQ